MLDLLGLRLALPGRERGEKKPTGPLVSRPVSSLDVSALDRPPWKPDEVKGSARRGGGGVRHSGTPLPPPIGCRPGGEQLIGRRLPFYIGPASELGTLQFASGRGKGGRAGVVDTRPDLLTRIWAASLPKAGN